MADISSLFTTFNCGRQEVNVDYFAASLSGSFTNATLPPDLIVLALQEISPIGFAFLGGSLLTPYFSKLAEAVFKSVDGRYGKNADYEHVITRNAGMTAIMMFARKSFRDSIQRIEEADTGVGVWEMGNKGAVGIRLGLEDDVLLTYVAAHLAPMETRWERRNEDWKNICENLVFEPSAASGRMAASSEQQPLLSRSGNENGGHHTIFSPPSYVFVAGDLNYRTSDVQPQPKDYESWPHPLTSNPDEVDFKELLTQDQLTREMANDQTLQNLAEAPITFAPTYNVQAQNWLWAKHRIPSWCDRILYLATAPPQVHSYKALPVQPTSDHRPVSLAFSIPRKPIQQSQQAISTFKIREDWKQRRAAAQRYELAVGLGAYLTLTGQGEALLAGTIIGIVGGYLVLSALLGST
ncbi:uncharacterized protein MYCFIDRAFT_46597 [Pseudocercospora fijiensis CIRAD86]|uniref:Inositol polyphosphate-related phosphatase domain-containing protein n=1 Tax=Pseudocercospora fijiensis (strain CIRAD86) TaxID=383855 RepID=M2Z650_PSEFD|nr:uncharacterized protein MYCFIDRAFT_46597 [Pseudocercospora fijiensis CIRAD86]EME85240.1 hypothetical protein MYCFIDRAFT_46597 [Pseudocercospora fijiensis CIRAD86]